MEPDAVIAAISDLRDFTEFSLGKLSRDMAAGFAAVDRRLGGVEGRLGGVEGRLTGVEGRLTGVEGRLDAVERRLGRVETRVEDLETTQATGFAEVRERLSALERERPRR